MNRTEIYSRSNKGMREKSFSISERATEDVITGERSGRRMGIKNSPLLNLEAGEWNPRYIQADAIPFQDSFYRVLPEGENMRDYIERMLAHKEGRAIGIELAGVGSRLFSDFTPGFFRKTAGINLTDSRDFDSPSIKGDDAKRNHTVIEGNILTPETRDDVKQWPHGEKIDLIMERMYGGLLILPQEPFFLSDRARMWYELLAEGGLLFAESPQALRPHLSQWETYIKEEHADKMEVSVSRNIIRIRKLQDVPLELLSARNILRR
ncbi:MAG: hypothetical protein H0W89_05330 [Candidatus Levybacteria bacterium]|nr:hypothetical protein [Candidatus Levybacteria bacterium]